jgi:putative tricarboxylic transport membrane protein
MRFNNAIPGAILIAFALAVITYSTTFPSLHGQDYGPNLFPTIISLGMIVCGGILILQGLAQRATEPMIVVGDWAQNRSNVLNVAILLGCIAFYILISDWLGFILTSLLILTTLLVRLGSTLRTSLIVAVATTFIIHTLFAKVLLVPLPWGILLPVAW